MDFSDFDQPPPATKDSDTIDWINFDKLAHITRYVGELIERIDAAPDDADRTPCDPFETEIRMLSKALGPALPQAMKYFGIKMPKTRQEFSALLDEKFIRHPAQSAMKLKANAYPMSLAATTRRRAE